jgi:uncharacterized membrane protein YjdF
MEFTHQRQAHHPLAWFATFLAISLDAGGDIFKFYQNIPHYDKYVHFTNSAIFAGVLLLYLYFRENRHKLIGWDYWFAWASVMAFGGLYEMEEFWESVFLHNNRWGGGSDTMTDITSNCLGALTAILIGWIVMKIKKHRHAT